ncbi:hypothetical protein HMPREF1400_01569 [Helicobacter pylori GAM119Bi]|nr:hypothetical protein HMPREF1400_01569 [Helicobacter pylori GAM119Bi]
MGLTLQALAFRFNFYFFFNKILFLIPFYHRRLLCWIVLKF